MCQCPKCPGEGVYLGTLGRLDHFSCRDCGWQFSAEAEAEDERGPMGVFEGYGEVEGDFHEANDGEGYFEGRDSGD